MGGKQVSEEAISASAARGNSIALSGQQNYMAIHAHHVRNSSYLFNQFLNNEYYTMEGSAN